MTIELREGMSLQPVHKAIKWEPIKIQSIKDGYAHLYDPNSSDSPHCCASLDFLTRANNEGAYKVIEG